MKKYLRAILLLLTPSFMLRLFKFGGGVGFSIVIVENLKLAPKAKIGHFNFIKCQTLKMENKSRIGLLTL